MPKKSIIEEFEDEKKDVKEIATQIKLWEDEGLNVAELKSAISKNMNMAQIEPLFSEYKELIPILHDVKKSAVGLDIRGFEKEYGNITSKWNEPRKARECQKELAELIDRMKKCAQMREESAKENSRRDALRQKIDGFRSEGFDVSTLEGALDTKNFDDVDKELIIFERNAQRIKSLKQTLKALRVPKGFEDMTYNIEKKLSNPYLVDEIEKDIDSLKEDLLKYKDIPRSDREKYRRKLSRYKADGYNIGHLETLVERDLLVLAKEFDKYEHNVRSLKEIWMQLEALDTTGYEADVKIIRSRLRDPYLFDETARMFEILKGKIEKRANEQLAAQQAMLLAQQQSQMQWAQPPSPAKYVPPSVPPTAQYTDGYSKEESPKPAEGLHGSCQPLPDARVQAASPQARPAPPPQPQFSNTSLLRNIAELVENGTREDWLAFFDANLRKNIKIKLPEIDPSKYKFKDYGYKRFIGLLIDSEDFFRMVTEIETVKDFKIVNMSSQLGGDEFTLRGFGAFCDLLYNHEARYNPTSSTEHQYLNAILNCLANPVNEGDATVWNIKTEAKAMSIKARFDKSEREWVYTVG